MGITFFVLIAMFLVTLFAPMVLMLLGVIKYRVASRVWVFGSGVAFVGFYAYGIIAHILHSGEEFAPQSLILMITAGIYGAISYGLSPL